MSFELDTTEDQRIETELTQKESQLKELESEKTEGKSLNIKMLNAEIEGLRMRIEAVGFGLTRDEFYNIAGYKRSKNYDLSDPDQPENDDLYVFTGHDSPEFIALINNMELNWYLENLLAHQIAVSRKSSVPFPTEYSTFEY
ncbi:MAG: hypothetical protein ABID64_01285 [Nitrospirota bacterium]